MRPGPFTIVLGLVLVVALLPRTWVAPWSGRLSELVSLPLVPVGDGFKAVRTWLVPTQDRVITGPEALVLEEQANQLRQSLEVARARISTLQRELERYRALESAGFGGRYRFVDARLVGAEPFPSGERLYVLNVGSSRGLMAGCQVVHRKDILLGLVVGDEVGRTRALVRPVASRMYGRLQARILQEEDGRVADDDALGVGVFLEPDGEGWTATIDESDAAAVRPGHQVVIADDTWGDSVGMRIGRVVSVLPSATSPLWRTLRVEPIERLDELHAVEVLVPVRSDEDGGDG